MPKSLWLSVAVLFGLALAANGIFMLVAPENWYFAVPGVTSTGPFNQHFLRDIGLIFLFLGGAFLGGAARRQFARFALGRPDPLALRPRPLPLLGSGGRYLLALRHCARLSSCHPAGDIGVSLTIWAIRNARSARAASASVHAGL